jgi:hypothetical protein
MSSDVERLEAKLAGLREEHASLTATRTREDMRQLVRDGLAAAQTRYAGSTGFLLGQHVGPEQMEAAGFEYLLADSDFWAFALAKEEAKSELTAKAKTARLRKLDAAIAKAEAELKEARKVAAIRAVEAEFAGDAA